MFVLLRYAHCVGFYPKWSILYFFGLCFNVAFFSHPGSAGEEVTIIKELGENVVLQCLDRPANTTVSVTRWTKGGVVLATHDDSSRPHTLTHITIMDNSSLSLSGLMTIDAEVYRCETEPKSPDPPHDIQLLITGTLECRGAEITELCAEPSTVITRKHVKQVQQLSKPG